jgi:hypothetical protein
MESNGIQVKQVYRQELVPLPQLADFLSRADSEGWDFAAIPPVSFQVESRIAMGGGPVPGVMVLLKRKSILSDSIR